MLDTFLCDVREVWRGLRSGRLIAGAAVLTLGMATGLAVAMVGLVDRALLSPPAGVATPHQLYAVAFGLPAEFDRKSRMTTTSYAAFATLRDEVPALEGAASWQTGPAGVVLDGEQIVADTVFVSGNYFDLLGARARIGRVIGAADERMRVPVAVLGHQFWASAFRRDRAVLGRRISIAGIDYEIAGVMAPGFSGHSTESVDVWVPIAAAMRATPGWESNPFRNIVSIVARIADGRLPEAVAQASAALERDVAFEGITGTAIGETQRRVAFWLTAVSMLVLFIGLANAATLLLVRGARRRRETAIRAALGAGRRRLIRHTVLEATLLGVVATGISLLAGNWLDEGVRRLLLPDLIEGGLPGTRAMLTAIGSGILACALASLAGVSTFPRTLEPRDVERRAGTARSRPQAALLLVQTAISVLLLAGAGMFARSLVTLMGQEFGMRTDGVLIVQFEQGAERVPGQDEIFSRALERIRALPGVLGVTAIKALPFGPHIVQPMSVPGRSDPPAVGQQLPFLISATPELFDILGIQIVEGRRLTPADDRGAPVVIVNETMARAVWPGESAVGRCIRVGVDPSFDPYTATGPPMPSESMPCREVVGVARDVRQRSVVPSGNEDRLMQYYVPMSQVPLPPAGIDPGPQIGGLLLRAGVEPSALIPQVRRLVLDGRSDLPYLRVRRYAELLERQVHPWRTGTALLALFGALAVGVAALGLYAAFAHAVGQRRREMAIRIAIGASPRGVLSMILREAVLLTVTGIVAGSVAAVFAGRTLQSLLYGIVPADPIVLGASAAVMLLVVVSATFLPARAAARSDPNMMLRAD